MMPRRMRIMDYRMDGRNPYGSAGGYVSSRRDRAMYDRRMMDRARGRDYGYDDMGYSDRTREYPNRYNDSENERLNSQRMGEYDERSRQYDRGSRYPFVVEGEFGRFDAHHIDPYMDYGMDYNYDMAHGRDYGYDMARGGRRDYASYDMARNSRTGRYMRDRDYGYDYADGMSILSERELKEWQKELMEEIEDKDKPMIKMDLVIKKAKDMGIEFDKFTEDEFYTTFLIIVTDYAKTLGTANIDTFIRLAKDWLCDKDSMLKYGEKLSSYKDFVVDGM